MAADFSTLPMIPGALETLNTERLVILEMHRIASRDGGAAIDPNLILSETNRWFDLWEGALSKKGYAAQEADLEAAKTRLKLEFDAASETTKNKIRLFLLFLEGSSKRRAFKSSAMAKILISLMREKVTGNLLRFRADHAARTNLTVVSLALAAWKADHREFPENLDALSPGYLEPMPLDPFTDRPFIYRRSGPGYILYSVWWNLKDDGGKDRDMVFKVE